MQGQGLAGLGDAFRRVGEAAQRLVHGRSVQDWERACSQSQRWAQASRKAAEKRRRDQRYAYLVAAFVVALVGAATWAAQASSAPVRWQVSTASVYDVRTGNAPACGWRYASLRRMVAHRSLPCGTRVRFMHRGRKRDAVVGDRGPFIGGRTWDLTLTLAADLGTCVCLPTVRWRILK